MALQNADLRSPEAAPTILGAGTALWKAIAWVSNVDFIMSIRNDTFATIFQFFLNHGWWIVLLICAIWGLQVRKEAKNKAPQLSWGMVIAIGLLTFISGILMTVYATGALPRVVVAWGGGARGYCNGSLDTSKLISFRKNQYVALACARRDPTIDLLNDERVVVSKPFTITGRVISISASIPTDLREYHDAPGSTSYYPVLIPKDVDISRFKRLSDIMKAGGKILDSAYYD